ncbi:fungal-specific transcription factor domain-containing protein [Dendryphion nanum]|uniref:Fungal-specific transcription factor domain-containing protein n=1 Tax=Dendryphion nanum TaxID=256645 RepID=A0A9P9IA23_9PLEO|nr:fungal-specific transcription factor domain-containing protein [Dendryphion nanum]
MLNMTSNECKRCKVKCVQLEDDADCQRCATLNISCIIVQTAVHSAKIKEKEKEKQKLTTNEDYCQLKEEVGTLRQQLTNLTATVTSILHRESSRSVASNTSTPSGHSTHPDHISPISPRVGPPKQPQFVGPTRSAFSFGIAKSALNRMGIPTEEHMPTCQSSDASSREATPQHVPEAVVETVLTKSDCLLQFSNDEISQFIAVYHEEVVSCQPIIDTRILMHNYPHILDLLRSLDQSTVDSSKIGKKDIHMLKVVAATAITHEATGDRELCDRLIASVEHDVGKISSHSAVELKDIQIMAMLSIYFCHLGEELFAWRAIGRAARQSLEMGLHRKQSLETHFPEEDSRNFAAQVFWVVYALDRRWSFGTSLSFALNDRDIDIKLPEPGKEHPYLNCMVTYGRLCSRVWEALPPYGSSSQLIPKETEDYLDFVTQNWFDSIPPDLQFKHPRLGLAPRSQPRILHRLRTLCYLRGNYMRLLIHRHHVLSPENIKANMKNARMVVNIAEDSIGALVHMNYTTDIYVRQQAIYHFYLLSSLAVMLLAVCHAPSMFAETCRESFASAVELVRGFSSHSSASNRLWKSIRGLLPVVRSLESRANAVVHHSDSLGRVIQCSTEPIDQTTRTSEHSHHQVADTEDVVQASHTFWNNDSEHSSGGFGTSPPDIYNLSNDLMSLYDAFGSAGMDPSIQVDPTADTFGSQNYPIWDVGEISRHFEGLI